MGFKVLTFEFPSPDQIWFQASQAGVLLPEFPAWLALNLKSDLVMEQGWKFKCEIWTNFDTHF